MAEPIAWEHRPADGPIAWGVSVLVAPVVPLLCYVTFLLLTGLVLDGRHGLGFLLAPVPWLVVGVAFGALAHGRRLRGLGLGLAAGSVTASVLSLIVVQGGWR